VVNVLKGYIPWMPERPVTRPRKESAQKNKLNQRCSFQDKELIRPPQEHGILEKK
jgi:hypothetical protein